MRRAVSWPCLPRSSVSATQRFSNWRSGRKPSGSGCNSEEQSLPSCITLHLQTRFCVYLHSYNSLVFYVGKGKPYRPFETSRRNHKWTEFVSSIDAYDVEIVLWTNDAEEAQLTEARLIRELAPPCNLMMNGYINITRNAAIATTLQGHEVSQITRDKVSKARKGIIPNGWKGRHHSQQAREKIGLNQHRIPVVCDQTGESFPSIKAAAESLAISKTNLRLHLKGRLRHVCGYTFRSLS
jgi:hypothetical protein